MQRRYTSTRISSRERPRDSAMKLGEKTSLCPSTGANMRSTSSGVVYPRPQRSAQPREARSSARLPRTEAPIASSSSSRVARTSLIVQRRTRSST